jgi:preprotein translocase subunit SecA
MVTNAIVKAQRKVEGRNFDIRKHLLEFDDVANDQRQVIYQQRNDLLTEHNISEIITNVRADVIDQTISAFIPPDSLDEQWDVAGLEKALSTDFAISIPVQKWLDKDDRLDEEAIREKVVDQVQTAYDRRYAHLGDQMREVERLVMLQLMDNLWKDHLHNMDQLRQGIGLRAYAQKNPKQEYKRESFALFEELLDTIKHETIKYLSHVQIANSDDVEKIEEQRRRQESQRQYQHSQVAGLDETSDKEAPAERPQAVKPVQRSTPKVGRNSPCPCGSGKKYKQCCGKI